MDINQATNVIYQVIEQANGQGFFKTLQQLDLTRQAYEVIIKELNAAKEPEFTIIEKTE